MEEWFHSGVTSNRQDHCLINYYNKSNRPQCVRNTSFCQLAPSSPVLVLTARPRGVYLEAVNLNGLQAILEVLKQDTEKP
jgi:hypothetical protein